MTLAKKNLLWVACILLVSALCARLFSSTPSDPEPTAARATAARATTKPVEVQSDARAKREIRAAYDHMDAAIEAKNVNGFMAFLAPDYTRTDRKGKVVDRLRTERSLSHVFQLSTTVTCRHRELHTSVQEDRASVKVEVTMAITTHRDATGKAVVLEAMTVSEDTWILTNDGWRLSREKDLSLTMKEDGKPIPQDQVP